MTTASFATDRRLHLGLGVRDVETSVAFYRTLLGHDPTKQRHGYAKFECDDPILNLSLIAVAANGHGAPVTGPGDPVTHFGLEVKSTEAVAAASARLADAGVATQVEEQVLCCYAEQTKVWATDPDGHRWEVYVVLDADPQRADNEAAGCCEAADTGAAAGVAAAADAGAEAACCPTATPGCCDR